MTRAQPRHNPLDHSGVRARDEKDSAAHYQRNPITSGRLNATQEMRRQEVMDFRARIVEAPLPMKVTYYLEVISSWCYWAEPAWVELKQHYAGRVEFRWKLALMDASGLPLSRSQCEWFYRRSGTIMRSPFMLNSGWFEPGLKVYLAPNLVAEAAKEFGVTDDRVRLAIANAALREGRKVGNWAESAAIAAAAAGLDAAALLEKAKSPEVEARARATTAEF